jgi:hypothetical protein
MTRKGDFLTFLGCKGSYLTTRGGGIPEQKGRTCIGCLFAAISEKIAQDYCFQNLSREFILVSILNVTCNRVQFCCSVIKPMTHETE